MAGVQFASCDGSQMKPILKSADQRCGQIVYVTVEMAYSPNQHVIDAMITARGTLQKRLPVCIHLEEGLEENQYFGAV